MSAARRRAILLAAAALLAGALAAARVRSHEAEIEARVGPAVPVLVARADLRAGTRLGDDPARLLALREVPAAFAPPDALADPAEAAGLRVGAPVPRGGYVTAGALAPPEDEEAEQLGPRLRAGERAAEVAVAGAASLAPGMRADVVVTSEPRTGQGRSYVAIEDVEVLDVRPADEAAAPQRAGAGASPPSAVATLRVTAHQAVLLAAAGSFARELRLLARPPGDRRRVRGAAVGAGEL